MKDNTLNKILKNMNGKIRKKESPPPPKPKLCMLNLSFMISIFHQSSSIKQYQR